MRKLPATPQEMCLLRHTLSHLQAIDACGALPIEKIRALLEIDHRHMRALAEGGALQPEDFYPEGHSALEQSASALFEAIWQRNASALSNELRADAELLRMRPDTLLGAPQQSVFATAGTAIATAALVPGMGLIAAAVGAGVLAAVSQRHAMRLDRAASRLGGNYHRQAGLRFRSLPGQLA